MTDPRPTAKQYKGGNAVIDRLIAEHFPEDKGNLFMVNGPKGRKPIVVPPPGGEGAGSEGSSTPTTAEKRKEAITIYLDKYTTKFIYFCPDHGSTTAHTKPGCCKAVEKIGEVTTRDKTQNVVE